MSHQLGDKPIEPRLHDMMNAIARGLDAALNGDAKGIERKNGFVLMVYPFANVADGDARCNYISNGADRKDIVVLMKEIHAYPVDTHRYPC